MASPPDLLNAKIGVLTRREVEARVLAPIIQALGQEFEREKVITVVRETIIRLAQEQGAELAEMMGGCTVQHFAESLQFWTKDEALEIEVLEQTDEKFSFDVNRCRYAELYQALGMPELGAVLSCNRDFALIDGFNPAASLTRSHTIMEGANCCDFRYTFKPDSEGIRSEEP